MSRKAGKTKFVPVSESPLAPPPAAQHNIEVVYKNSFGMNVTETFYSEANARWTKLHRANSRIEYIYGTNLQQRRD